jgi:hypothetical protein
MKAQHQHHKQVASAILQSVDPGTFAPTRLTAKVLNDDSCWEENESDFEETLPGFVLGSMDDDF